MGDRKHKAVIFFHGIGDPKRHASISNLLDHFDIFGQSQDKSGIGKPRDFTYKTELCADEPVNYIEFKRVQTVRKSPRIARIVRVYEAYWSPEAKAKFGIFYIFKWILGRIIIPVKVAISRWRSYAPLRLLVLHLMVGKQISLSEAQKLERFYRDFENWESRETFKTGSFKEFLGHLYSKTNESIADNLLQKARQWRRAFIIYNIKFLFVFLCVSLFILTLASFFLFLIVSFIFSDVIFLPDKSIYAVPILVFALTAVWINLKDYMYDVIVWTMEAEKDGRYDNRKEILKYGQKLIRHVVSDSKCDECVIISHSLGTSIAMESLLHEGQKDLIKGINHVDSNINKITHVVTIGSPIDRIFYWFQADKTFSHRYNRLFEEKRLSVGLPPFWMRGHAGKSKIINFWSRFDPISSSIFSLSKSLGERQDSIVNYEVFPGGSVFPFRSHTSYFTDRSLMKNIYWIVMAGRLPGGEAGIEGTGVIINRSVVWGWIIAFVVLSVCISLYLFDVINLPSLLFVISLFFILSVLFFFYRKKGVKKYIDIHGSYLRR